MANRGRVGWVIALLGPAASAATIQVGPGQKIGDAVSSAAPDDVIVVAPGTYPESLSLTGSGTAGAPITISATGAVLAGTITLDGDHWRIEGLAITPGPGVDAVRVKGSFNRFQKIEISGGTRDGIDGGGTGNQVLDSTIHDLDAGTSDAHCIVLNPGASDWVIAGNTLYDCSGDGVQLYSSGPERSIKNVQILGNTMYYSGAIGRMENAVDVKNADGLVIANNRMYGFTQNKTLVFQKGPANIEVRCNVMSDGFTGVEFRAEDGGTLEKVKFVRNSMVDFTSYALKFDDVYEGQVYNNTFVSIASDGLRIEGGGLHSGEIKNNLWAHTGTVKASQASADYNGFFNANNQLAGAHDVTADPLLDSQRRLALSSPMIDAGTDVGLPFFGAAPDIGAFETGGADPCMTSAVGGSGGAGGGAAGTGAVGGSGATGSGATGSGATGSGATGSGGSAATGATPSTGGDDGGCGCRAAGVPSSPRSGWLVGALLALACARRRKLP